MLQLACTNLEPHLATPCVCHSHTGNGSHDVASSFDELAFRPMQSAPPGGMALRIEEDTPWYLQRPEAPSAPAQRPPAPAPLHISVPDVHPAFDASAFEALTPYSQVGTPGAVLPPHSPTARV